MTLVLNYNKSLHFTDSLRHVFEVWVLHSHLRCNSFGGVTLEHLVEQIETFGAQRWYFACQRLRLEVQHVLRIERKLSDARPVLFTWRTSNIKNLLQLLFFVITSKKRLLVDNLSKNAPNRPYIDRCAVVFTAHENIRCSIPQRHNFMREIFHGNPKSSR